MTVSRQPERIARWFHALADETRLGIVERLRAGERCVCDLTDDLDASQSRLSFHLKTLKDAGIVTDRRQGRWVYYALNPQTMAAMEEFVRTLRATAKLRVLAGSCE
jgi:ArsR family transcriptional regulator, arsenate/arsenite/antimonite-responsive transcriptional repressor